MNRLLQWLSNGSTFELIDESEVYRIALEKYEAQVRDALEQFVTATNGRRKSNVIQMLRRAA